MVDPERGVFKASANIFGFEIWVIRNYFGWECAAREHVQNVLDPDAHASDAGVPPALLRIVCDS